jgi:16S rRNA A1518/A1519 N6-dimethyltransferase RsmA/KsgA/DIM1 with predicted DNA glycosylase/AP lyase activity
MVNEQVNSAMVQLAGIQPGDLILEIGPGTGSLTKFLVEAGAHIIAVEKDQDMAALVAERFAHTDQVEVIFGLICFLTLLLFVIGPSCVMRGL